MLRQLFPYTSHWNVKLSSTTAFPYEGAVPAVMQLPGGRFRVMGGDPFRVIGERGSAEEAVALVAAHLPPGLRMATTGLPMGDEPMVKPGMTKPGMTKPGIADPPPAGRRAL
ncbi:DUF6193 family natural product biosynthesis protein [Streptomyces sp. H34-S4]|uniref:DUF6193 family natural product biosynthesis protein n=1 Tax=Streptomyces sp. H34-S4 TaxID=2996463 RepID=UPI003B638E9F